MREKQLDGRIGQAWRRGVLILGLVFAFGAFAQAASQQEEGKDQEAAASEEMATAVDEMADAPAAQAGESSPFEVSGALSLSYRARIRDDDNDEDLYGYLRLDGGRAENRDLSFHFYGRATYDLDGDVSDGSNTFFSINDVGGDRLDAKLYEAWIDLEGDLVPSSLGVRRIRLGRQRVHAGLSFLMDGGRIDFRKVDDLGNLEIAIFGGVPEYLYEASRSGDWMAGIDVNIRPSKSTRLDFRYVHIEDENRWVGGEASDDFVSVDFMQEFFENFRIFTTWNSTGFDTRDIRVRANLEIPDWDLEINAVYFFQEKITREYTTLLDYFEGVLGVSYAYHQIDLEISKWFGEHFGLDAGFTLRELEDDDEEAAFNREFHRLWLTFSTQQWPVEDVDLALTFEWWDGSADETLSLGGELDWRATEDLRVSFGSFYSLYKYDLFVVDERTDVTTIFLKLRWKLDRGFRLDGRYEFETGDEGDYHTFFLGFDWRF